MPAVSVVRPTASHRGGGAGAMRFVRRASGSLATSRRAKSGGIRESFTNAAASHRPIISGLRGRESGATGKAGRCPTIRAFLVSLAVSEVRGKTPKRGDRGSAVLAAKASTT